jgi:NADH:ubiquinone reductase (H+-translocating)
MSETESPRIVIVGGGAGGLELATRLGDKLGKKKQAKITLIDKARTHIWKPKLHEVAAGSMDVGQHELSYLAQAHWHHFHFRCGEMTGLDRAGRTVSVAATRDETGAEITPPQHIPYDVLVLAVGSRSNDFGTPGAAKYAITIDSASQAARFHQRLVNICLQAQVQNEPLQSGQLDVCIVGAGATGVELAAELHKTTRELVSYGLDRIDPDKHLKISIIEAADRVLPGLPERFSAAISKQLRGLDIAIHTGARVTEVTATSVKLDSGDELPARLTVWAAGVKAPDFLGLMDGLETNRLNQVLVKPTLQTKLDANIFAIGDCTSCPWLGRDGNVPPRAQAAHQQASHLYANLLRRLAGKPLHDFQYRDFGSLVSLGKFSAVGSLMGGIIARSFWIEGYFARLMYVSLYKMHELALHGIAKVSLDTLARLITRRTEPTVKLH